MLRHQRDVDDADLIAPFVDPEPADGLTVALDIALDDVPFARRIVDSVVLELRGKLLVEEHLLLRLIERKARHLLGARRLVEPAHEIVIGVGSGAKDDRFEHALYPTTGAEEAFSGLVYRDHEIREGH